MVPIFGLSLAINFFRQQSKGFLFDGCLLEATVIFYFGRIKVGFFTIVACRLHNYY